MTGKEKTLRAGFFPMDKPSTSRQAGLLYSVTILLSIDNTKYYDIKYRMGRDAESSDEDGE